MRISQFLTNQMGFSDWFPADRSSFCHMLFDRDAGRTAERLTNGQPAGLTTREAT
jgi:hypothetical protein